MKRASVPANKRQRLLRRITRHHLPLALITLVGLAAVDLALSPGSGKVTRFTVDSAYVGLVLIAATLIIGPLNLLRRRPNPVSADLRRDIGIWAALVSIAHMLVGFLTHAPGEPWRFFFDDTGKVPIRVDTFAQANYLGLGAALGLLVLLACSNDWSLRALGSARWKAIQRFNYVILGLVAAHALIYMPYEDRGLRFQLPFALVALAVLGLQLAGVRARRRLARPASPPPLAEG